MQKMFEEIFEKIKEAPVITIYRHTMPDMDSLGSQMGMKKALQHLFPEKEIYILGKETKPGFVMDDVDDDTVKESLGILLDTSNKERVDDARFFEAKDTVRFDHHIKTEELAASDYVDEKAGATGEVLANFFKEMNQDIGAEAAQDLYQALSADTARFTTSNTRPESLEAGAWLLRQGANVVRTDQVNNGISLADFKYGALIRRKATRENRLLFSVMSKTDWMSCGLDETTASKKAFMLGGVKEIDIWALFTEDFRGLFTASLRARTREVRDIAAEYGGGGHVSAAGIGGLTAIQVMEIIKKLSERSIESDEDRIAREERQAKEKAEREAAKAAQEAEAAADIEEKAEPAAEKMESPASDEAETASPASSDTREAKAE